jgi:hypothetical protein
MKAPQTVLTFSHDRPGAGSDAELCFLEGEWPANPKTILAKAGKGVTIKKVDVTSSSGDFTAKVEPGSTEGEFKIQIQPKDTAKPLNASFTIKPDLTPAKVFLASARVLPPGTAQP